MALLVSATMLGAGATACSSDGREMNPPLPNQVQTIIDDTAAPTVIDGSLESTTAPPDVFTLVAPWNDGDVVPIEYTCSGDGTSPPLSWFAAPIETQSFALVVTDLDSNGPTGDPLVHWVVANIDPFVTQLDAGSAPLGAVQAINDLVPPDLAIAGWSPPCPPLGDTHTYAVTLHALSQRLDLPDATPAADLVRAIELASLASTVVFGTVTS